MPVDIPDEVARRVRAVADQRGVRPEQVVIEAVETELGSSDGGTEGSPFSSAHDDLRRMAFDGSLRSDIDALVDDPDLAVG